MLDRDKWEIYLDFIKNRGKSIYENFDSHSMDKIKNIAGIHDIALLKEDALNAINLVEKLELKNYIVGIAIYPSNEDYFLEDPTAPWSYNEKNIEQNHIEAKKHIIEIEQYYSQEKLPLYYLLYWEDEMSFLLRKYHKKESRTAANEKKSNIFPLIFPIFAVSSAFCINYFFILPYLYNNIIGEINEKNNYLLKLGISLCVILISLILVAIFESTLKEKIRSRYSIIGFNIVYFFFIGLNISSIVLYFPFYFFSFFGLMLIIYIVLYILKSISKEKPH